MSIKSNLYAEKVFAEHPLSLWTIDDRLDYVSLINESYRDVSSWTTVSGSEPEYGALSTGSPFPESGVYEISSSGDYSLEAPAVDSSMLDEELGSVTVSAYLKVFSGEPETIRFGIKGLSVTTKSFSLIPVDEWFFVSATFDLPTNDFKVYLEVESYDELNIAMNGLSVGQWSSVYASQSLGITPQTISNVSSLSGNAVLVQAYGVSELDGYALFDGNKQLCRSYGLPIVYGTRDSVVVGSNSGLKPSIVFPGLGFMNNSGKSSDYTLEFWTKIKQSTRSLRRLVGPIASSDGIYVDGAFIGIAVGGNSAYHYVGEWDRPMLISMSISESYAKLFVNGDETVSIEISNALYPLKKDNEGVDQDWIGFYAYEDFSDYLIECVSIYPYLTADVLSKRRFVYGQGVDTISSIDSSFGGTTAVFDSKFLKSSRAYSYPDIGSWGQGTPENILAGQYRLSSPEYELPRVALSEGAYSRWVSDTVQLSRSAGNVASIRPNSSWDISEGYLAFDSLSIINDPVRCVYGVFEARQTHSSRQTLLKIFDKTTKDYFSIDIEDGEVAYFFKYGSSPEIEIFRIKDADGALPAKIGLGEIFSVGLDIDSFILKFGFSLSAFFGNRSRLSLYVAGSVNFSKTFDGFIHRVGICSERNFTKAYIFFDDTGTIPIQEAIYDGGEQGSSGEPIFTGELDGGFAGTEFPETIVEHVATYTLFPNGKPSVFDVATDSYWDDYIPLSRLSQVVTLADGTKINSVGFLQFNVDYPRSTSLLDEKIATNKEIVKTYVSFQSIMSPNKSSAQFANTQAVSSKMIVVADENWRTTKYEVVDGCTILPPEGVNTNSLSINIHIEIKTPGVRSKLVSIRSVSLTAKSFDYSSPSKIGSKFAIDAIAYKKYGPYSTYWSTVPFAVHKTSSPYLYLTSDYGILVHESDTQYETGISIPINESLADEFFVSAINMVINPSYMLQNEMSGPFAEINFLNEKLLVVAQYDSYKRYRVYLANSDLEEISSINYFVNGVPTIDAYIFSNQWSSLAFAFSTPLNFSNVLGAIRMLPGMRYASISAFRMSGKDKSLYDSFESDELRENILRSESEANIYWQQKRGVFGSRYFGANPEELYLTYTGTNRFAVGDNATTLFNGYRYKVYKNIQPVTISVTPV